MRMRTLGMQIAAGLAAAGAAGVAIAAPCYVILDRNDAVVYRDPTPPFDLSVDNSPERKALRQRGEHLLVAEWERCDAAGYISPTTSGTSATVDEIVTGLQPAIATSIGSNKAAAAPAKGPAGARAAAAPKASAPATKR